MKYQAISCRVRESTHDAVKQTIEATGKSVSQFVTDAVEYYIQCIQGNNTPTTALRIDEFAYNTSHENDKPK